MLKRTVTAVVAVAIFIPVCVFSGTVVWPLAMTVLSVMAAYEMTKCVGAGKHLSLLIPAYIVAAVMPITFQWLNRYGEGGYSRIVWLCTLYLILTFAADVFSRGKIDFTTSAASFMGVFYTSFAFTCLVYLRNFGSYFYLLVFIGPWTSDTFAYLVGRLLGKHKLIPEVSPKKTVEGSVGGILFAALAYVIFTFIIKTFFDSGTHPDYLAMAAAGAIVSVISQIGDLAMSVIKRRYDVKDYGWIFPGHGGVLDRFDSVLMSAPVLLFLAQIPAVYSSLEGNAIWAK